MQTFENILKILANKKEEIKQKYGVVILAVFGFYSRAEQNEMSNIDLLVEIQRPTGFKFFELWDYFEKFLRCDVELVRARLL